MKILAFIPARAGSKRIKNKNLQDLNNSPLISYTIMAAKQSRYINRVVVSTDSKRIAAVSEKYGAEVPFLRPAGIAGSKSTEMQFFSHALKWFKENEGYSPDLIVLLYPTAPFRRSESIDEAIKTILKFPNAHSLRSITPCSEHPYKMWTIKGGLLEPFVRTKIPNAHTLPYSMLPRIYTQNANIYITKPSTIFNQKSPTGRIILPFIMGEFESVDINNPADLLFARAMFNYITKQRRD